MEQDVAIRAAQALGLGVAGVDLIRSKRGPLVLEVNASPGLEGIEAASEVDVAGAVIDFVGGRFRPRTSRQIGPSRTLNEKTAAENYF
jgi:ribosomal protein S6--L-glutamate ligase